MTETRTRISTATESLSPNEELYEVGYRYAEEHLSRAFPKLEEQVAAVIEQQRLQNLLR